MRVVEKKRGNSRKSPVLSGQQNKTTVPIGAVSTREENEQADRQKAALRLLKILRKAKNTDTPAVSDKELIRQNAKDRLC